IAHIANCGVTRPPKRVCLSEQSSGVDPGMHIPTA
ncbi:unnamed protein product, partial [Brassica rapa subsp. narinosa]